MLGFLKVSPSKTSIAALSLLEEICSLKDNEITKSSMHRLRELDRKLKQLNRQENKNSQKLKIVMNLSNKTDMKKNLKLAIQTLMEVKSISQELEKIARRLIKMHDKIVQDDIKNTINLFHAASKSCQETIRFNKELLKTVK